MKLGALLVAERFGVLSACLGGEDVPLDEPPDEDVGGRRVLALAQSEQVQLDA